VRGKITPFLWFESQAEDATRFYVSVFKDSEILSIDRMGGDDGPVFTTSFRIENETFIALNAGPNDDAQFNDSISFMIDCADQDEVDYFWDALTADGGKPGRCGWLRDKFGVAWQVTPKALNETLGGPDREGAGRAMQAMMQMTKLDVAKLKAAYNGE
jgi:predicted 3-demethylubiquinone-9 3-methyltransferase (glyoxalase superfamily)